MQEIPLLQRINRRRRPLLAGIAVLLLAGCGGPDAASQVAALNDSNLRRVANLYMAFQFRNGMRGPRDEQEFRDFIQNDMSPRKLEMMKVDPQRIDELFTSEQTGQPFEINYGVTGGTTSVLAVVFDQEGADGKRRVGFTNGPVEVIDRAQYDQLIQNPQRAE